MKKWWYITAISAVMVIFLWCYLDKKQSNTSVPLGEEVAKRELPYEKYQFEKLAERGGVQNVIEIGREIGKGEGYTSYVFYYQSEGRRISGQLNIPHLSRLMGVVVMARGYVEKEGYQTGIGTRSAAAVYAKNGYMTLAPDFSGYGESSSEDTNAIGARLVKPVEIIDLIASLPSLPQVDLTKVYLWGHSNGGQIMLSVAEIAGMGRGIAGVRIKGMTLWAPVTKPFPYNILYYTDEASDQGKWLRAEIAKFEEDYDVYDYSLDKYWNRIKIPILVHQGDNDESVPKKWSDEAVKQWVKEGLSVTYFVYPGADHNLRPSWNQVVSRDLDFFASL